MQYLTVKNWDRFQHYKDRKPTWIKLYCEILDKYQADGTQNPVRNLSDRAFRLLVNLWLLRSRYDRLPNDPVWVKEQTGVTVGDSIQELLTEGLVSLYQIDTDLYQSDTEVLASETETETETETYHALRASARERVVEHYCRRFARAGYDLTTKRKGIIDEAVNAVGVEIICQAIDLYRDHPAFEFNRNRKDDGLCEYILRKGRDVGVRERLDWIFRKAGKELSFA